MKARELKDLRANNPQDLVAKLGELNPIRYMTIRKSYENKRSKEIYSPNQNHH